MPKNLALRLLLSILADPLPCFTDLVHVRFFVVVVQNGDPNPLIGKIKRMLKPGGFLQWTEMDHETLHVEAVSSPETLIATQDLFNMAQAPCPQWPAK